ncbi:MAG: hypothetical protein LOD84_02800, partial [Limnochordales bacterium]
MSAPSIPQQPAYTAADRGPLGAGFWWALLILAAGLGLPWSRQGVNVLEYDAARTGLRLVGEAWPIAAALALAGLLLFLGRPPVPHRAAGRGRG